MEKSEKNKERVKNLLTRIGLLMEGATENILGSPCRFCTFSFDVWVEQQLSYELERQPNSTRKDKQNAIHGHSQSHERHRKRRRTPRSPAHGRHEQIQRRALRSRRLVGLRRSSPLLQRRPRPLLRQELHRHRRSLRRKQGTHRRLLVLAGQVSRRGHRVGQALSRFLRRRLRHRDSPGLRARRLRNRLQRRGNSEGKKLPRTNGS